MCELVQPMCWCVCGGVFRGYQQGRRSVSVGNTLIKDTYLLLSLTLVFSSFVAWISVMYNARPVHFLIAFPVMITLMVLIGKYKHSVIGLFLVFVFTGFFGYLAGPHVNSVMSTYSNGANIVSMSLFATGFIFTVLSSYAHFSTKDFSFMGSFLGLSFFIVLLVSLSALFYESHFLSFICGGFVMILSCGWILYTTSRIKNGGETSYVNATVELYLSIYNIFMMLLEIFSMFTGRR